jgi:hypothetical protein
MFDIRNDPALFTIVRAGQLVVQETLEKTNSITTVNEKSQHTAPSLSLDQTWTRNNNHLRLEVRPMRISHCSDPQTKPHGMLHVDSS